MYEVIINAMEDAMNDVFYDFNNDRVKKYNTSLDKNYLSIIYDYIYLEYYSVLANIINNLL